MRKNKLSAMMMLAVYAVSVGSAAATVLPTGVAQTQNAMANFSQLRQSQKNQVAVSALSTNLRVFTVAASAYVYENVGSVPWNESDSMTPIVYAPFLIYAGKNASACGFSGGSGQSTGLGPVDLTTSSGANIYKGSNAAPYQFLPSGWKPAMGGTYCAVVWLNSPAAQQAAMATYYVAPNGAKSTVNNLTIMPTSLVYQTGQSSTLKNAFPMSETMWAPQSSATGGPAGTPAGMSGESSVTTGSPGQWIVGGQ